MLYQERFAIIGSLAKQKEAERNARLGIIDDFTENDGSEDNLRKLIEQKENENNCYLPGQLRKRLNKARTEIWYLNALSNKDITKYELVRKSYLVDAFHCLENIINSMG